MQLPEPGDVFERRYEILQVLGQGGFARVFRARDIEIGRTVALKVITPRDGEYSETSNRRFEREAQVIASLQDPHNITLFDYGTASSGLQFMVFEFVDGVDLKKLLRQGALPPSVVVHMMLQLCAALREAHSIGLLHRDLKPGNVLVFEYAQDPYRVKLIDFGIAKPTDPDRSRITQAGGIVGTARYMSPEQALAQPVTERTDIYSLGLVACEMLTGHPAVQGTDRMTLIRAHVVGDRIALPVGAAPPALARVVDRMVRREPSDRYGSLQEVASDLGRARQELKRGQVAESPPGAESSESLPEPVRRDDSRWATFVLAGTAFVIVFLIVAALLPTPPREPPRALTALAPPKVVNAAPKKAEADVGLRDVGKAADAHAPPLLNGSSGCGTSALTQSAELRRVELHLPDDYDARQPHALVVLLNQRWESARDLLANSGFVALADEHRFIVLAPEDRLRGWKTVGDVAAVRDIVEISSENLCVDESRVFVVSNGTSGRTAMLLACEPWVTGIATNSHDIRRGRRPCGMNEKPLIWITPKDSTRIPVGGGSRCGNNSPAMSSAQIDASWRKRNRCRGRATVRRLEGGECRAWECETPYESCVVDGGYGWPRLRYDFPNSTQGCNDEPPPGEFGTAAVIWSFFDQLP